MTPIPTLPPAWELASQLSFHLAPLGDLNGSSCETENWDQRPSAHPCLRHDREAEGNEWLCPE